MSGTSQATAFVTGAAALLASQDKSFNFRKLKAWLLSGAKKLKNKGRNKNKNISAGLLSIPKSLVAQRSGVKRPKPENIAKGPSRTRAAR